MNSQTKKCKSIDSKYFHDPKKFIEYLNDMDVIKVLINTIQIKDAKYILYLMIFSMI